MALERQRQHAALRGRPVVVVEDEVAQPVVHVLALEEAAGLEHVRVAADDRVRPGGRVVYSTCSIEPEENEAVVTAALAGRTDVRVEDTTLHLPGDPADGGFQAPIVKN